MKNATLLLLLLISGCSFSGIVEEKVKAYWAKRGPAIEKFLVDKAVDLGTKAAEKGAEKVTGKFLDTFKKGANALEAKVDKWAEKIGASMAQIATLKTKLADVAKKQQRKKTLVVEARLGLKASDYDYDGSGALDTKKELTDYSLALLKANRKAQKQEDDSGKKPKPGSGSYSWVELAILIATIFGSGGVAYGAGKKTGKKQANGSAS